MLFEADSPLPLAQRNAVRELTNLTWQQRVDTMDSFISRVRNLYALARNSPARPSHQPILSSVLKAIPWQYNDLRRVQDWPELSLIEALDWILEQAADRKVLPDPFNSAGAAHGVSGSLQRRGRLRPDDANKRNPRDKSRFKIVVAIV